MLKGRLSVKKIERLTKPGAAPGRYGDGGNLFLQVPKREGKRGETWSGAPSWLFRYARGGKERMLGLGPLHTWGLDEARERARELRQQLGRGIDPLAARKAQRAKQEAERAKTVTFKEVAEQYYEAHRDHWRNEKHAAQFLRTLETYAYPHIGRLAVSDIDTGLVLKCIEPHWKSKTETADRVRNRIERVLDFATVRGLRTGDNPARWRGHLSEALPKRAKTKDARHHPALPYAEIPAFMAKLRERTGTAARALEFLILTCARTGEVTGARWQEIDLDKRIWTVPAGRIKAGREHRVPLSDRAIEILKLVPRERGDDHVFIGPTPGRGLSNMAMSALLDRMGAATVTVHGFRSSFRDWAAETTNHPREVCEMALAHVVGDAVERAYQRGDMFEKRRRLARDWATYCASPPRRKPVSGDNIVALHG
jgi:integrase